MKHLIYCVEICLEVVFWKAKDIYDVVDNDGLPLIFYDLSEIVYFTLVIAYCIDVGIFLSPIRKQCITIDTLFNFSAFHTDICLVNSNVNIKCM